MRCELRSDNRKLVENDHRAEHNSVTLQQHDCLPAVGQEGTGASDAG